MGNKSKQQQAQPAAKHSNKAAVTRTTATKTASTSTLGWLIPWLAISALSVALGVWTLLTLMPVIEPSLERDMAQCAVLVNDKQVRYFGNAQVDSFTCLFVKFFRDSVLDLAGLETAIVLVPLAMSVILVYAVESSRLGVSYLNPLAWYGLTIAMAQFLGISLTTAIWWVPLILWQYRTSAVDSRISVARVILIAVALLPLLFPGIGVLFFVDETYMTEFAWCIIAYIGLTMVVFVLWVPAPVTQSSVGPGGHVAVIAVHTFAAGASLALYAYGLVVAYKAHTTLYEAMYGLLLNSSTNPYGYFLLFDTWVLFAALVLFALGDSGVQGAVLLTVGAIVVSPGTAVSLYFACREARFLQSYPYQQQVVTRY